MSELDETLDKLRQSNRELTQVLLDIVRPVDPSNFPNPFDVDVEEEREHDRH